ncbi:uncharacterized protein JCM6883_006626 [Sporobolomyces salmoneus]|uniref:uncharacterized protein n=1 Tax=Sporobolomyces salmoneus TaxID=183962 RepID=UPI00316B81C8
MSSTPWNTQPSSQSMNPSPAALTSPSEPVPPPTASSSSQQPTNFSSSWGAFGLAQPRSNVSLLSMQLESHPIDQTSLFQRRSNSSGNGNGGNGGSVGGSALGRRQSMLGTDSAMMDEDQELSSSLNRMGSGDISMSASFDPVLPSNVFTMSSRSARSRSASESTSNHPFLPPPPPPLFGNVPPSPVTVARALQAGQKTPPAVFQRRLFKDDHMVDDGSNSEARSSRSGSSSDVGSLSNFSARDKGKRRATLSDMLQDEDEEIEELSMGLSRSTSGGDEVDARVVRRPVSRKPNLLPKPKSHLRVLSDLRSESSPGGDLAAEIASEATLHRLSRSGASTVPPLRPSTSLPASTSSQHHHHHHFDPSSSASVPSGSALGTGGGILSSSRPTPNRFPEQAEEDDPLLVSQISESSSSDEDRDLDETGATADLEIGSDWGGASATGGYETGPEDGGGGALEEARKMQMVWNGIRSGGGSRTSVSAHHGANSSVSVAKSPSGGSSRGMDFENPFNIPQTPSASFTSRPGKRKNIEDRFEPYSHALKRRAVSPAASSLSPGFGATNPSSTLPHATSTTLPVPIPSPTLSTISLPHSHHQSFFTSIHHQQQPGTSRSVVGSPIAPSSLSSSAGRHFGAGFGYSAFGMGGNGSTAGGGGLSERYRTPSSNGGQIAIDEERIKMDDGIGRMSLGGAGGVQGAATSREDEEL